MNVLITGISSPLGYYTAKHLLAKGWKVKGVSRSTPKAPLPEVKYIACNVCSPDIEKHIKNCQYIVHAAALSSPWGKKKDFFKTNLEGTKNILYYALRHHCQRLIFISSPSIYFEYKDHLNITEEYCAAKPVNHYAASKISAEDAVAQASKQGLETFILRPKAIFGPGDQVLIPRILQSLKSGGVPRFVQKDIILDITYVENISHAIFQSLTADSCFSGQAYNITNDCPLPLHTLIKMIIEKMGFKYKERHIPYRAAKIIAYICEKISLLTNKEPLFTPYSVGALSFSQTLSIDKAKKELNYQPIISIEEGIEKYEKWWKNNNLN
jgi:nucleoside-diphosphate-sugar epimerase